MKYAYYIYITFTYLGCLYLNHTEIHQRLEPPEIIVSEATYSTVKIELRYEINDEDVDNIHEHEKNVKDKIDFKIEISDDSHLDGVDMNIRSGSEYVSKSFARTHSHNHNFHRVSNIVNPTDEDEKNGHGKDENEDSDDEWKITDDGIGSQYNWKDIAKLNRIKDNLWIVNDLDPAHLYSLRACIRNKHGWSDFSDIITFETTSMINSCILQRKEQLKLISILANQNILYNSIQLLFRASKDGYSSKAFHQNCDGYSNTITILISDKNRVMGGFTNVAWSTDFGYKRDEAAFLFALRHERKLKHHAFKIKSSQDKKAVYHSPDAGPIFGEGFDLFIQNQCNDKPQNISNPKSYHLQQGIFSDGQGSDRIVDYEVFHLAHQLNVQRRGHREVLY